MRSRNKIQNDSSAQSPQTDAVRSVNRGRRFGLFMLILFVVVGTSLFIYFSVFWLPEEYRLQAARMIAPDIRAAQVNDVVFLGVYEQDNNKDNGAEPIEWIVLDREPDRCLLMSRYALDCVRFNSIEAYVSWDNSSILTWLNSTFYYDAFNGAERTMIVKSVQKTDTNPYFDTYAGEATNERIFLANIAQIAKYLPEEEERVCLATPYTVSRGAIVNKDSGSCIWWLRSPGFDMTVSTRILLDGRINYCGYRIQSPNQAVRPWMWVCFDPYSPTTEV